MKTIAFLVISSLLFLGCNKKLGDENYAPSPNQPTPNIDEINSELDTYVNQFEQRYGLTVSYPVLFDTGTKTGSSSNSGIIIGLCEVWSNGDRFIYINQSWFSNSTTSITAKKILIFHELGHCSFDRDHDSRKYSNGMPYSIMYPTINPIIPFFNTTYENYFLTELQNPGTSGTLSFMTQSSQPFTLKVYSFTESSCLEDHF